MALADDLKREVKSIFAGKWQIRDGQKVPETDELQLGNYGVRLKSTVLYADLAESTALVTSKSETFAAEVYKTYLYCAAKIITSEGGTITAYDGDRVMAEFIDDLKNTRAARTALKIKYAVSDIVNPLLYEQYPSQRGVFQVRHAVGIDTGNLLVARTGIRGSNDLVWVGRAANYAAKLCDIRESSYRSYITEDVYDSMTDAVKTSSDGRAMWDAATWNTYGVRIYRSSWGWVI